MKVQIKEAAMKAEPMFTSQKRRGVDTASIIGWVLQGGVIASATVIICGLLLSLVTGTQTYTMPTSIEQFGSSLFTFQPQAIIILGILLLIATPVLRVAISIFAFWLERDLKFVVITTLVLLILITSFLLGKGGA